MNLSQVVGRRRIGPFESSSQNPARWAAGKLRPIDAAVSGDRGWQSIPRGGRRERELGGGEWSAVWVRAPVRRHARRRNRWLPRSLAGGVQSNRSLRSRSCRGVCGCNPQDLLLNVCRGQLDGQVCRRANPAVASTGTRFAAGAHHQRVPLSGFESKVAGQVALLLERARGHWKPQAFLRPVPRCHRPDVRLSAPGT